MNVSETTRPISETPVSEGAVSEGAVFEGAVSETAVAESAAPPRRSWAEANKEYLVRALAPLREAVAGNDSSAARAAADTELATLAAAMPAPPTLEVLHNLFGLSDFERDLVLLCAGMELDSRLAAAVPAGGPTFSLALAVLPQPHWTALAPTGPLRRWRLLELAPGTGLTTGALRLDERVLHFLVGVNCLDERLLGILEPLPRPSSDDSLPPSQRAAAAELAASWARADGSVVVLSGADAAAKVAVAAQACAALGTTLGRVRAADVPAAAAERDALAVLLQREAAFGAMALLLDARGVESGGPQQAAFEAFVDALGCRLAVAAADARFTFSRPTRRLEVDVPTRREQRRLWQRALGAAAPAMAPGVERVTAQYRLDTRGIEDAAREALASPEGASSSGLWRACRRRTRGRLDDLAQRITPRAGWENLVLPDTQMAVLRDAATHMRQRARVYEDWGFAAASDRGLGISALFAGPSGTGKTMAAEVLANELELDLYRIDLSQVVSKYIGETEKNLGRVFDAADTAGALLLFDEADALFGKRSEVRDSHDRYANIEISYLLQRMESYRGVSVLTTNLREALDRAFLRRIRFVVQFPFPDAALRARIWAGIFPRETPTSGLDFERLAQLNVAGGGIRNIAMNAAFLAADRDGPVGPGDVLRAAQQEYAKGDKTISDSERRGWA
jgi:ATPase family associated with various cellular activities (AAA)/Winged helix domain, variant